LRLWSISTILRDLETDRPIKLGYRSVTVIHPARLRVVADDDENARQTIVWDWTIAKGLRC
jgi:hypothetical protein